MKGRAFAIPHCIKRIRGFAIRYPALRLVDVMVIT
jgi:hypothetical protein